jgi:hypothetical protein
MGLFDWLPWSRAKRELGQLRSSDPNIRITALQTLEWPLFDEKNNEFRQALIAALKDDNVAVRRAAVERFLPARSTQLFAIHEAREAAKEGDQRGVVVKFPFTGNLHRVFKAFGVDPGSLTVAPMPPSELRDVVERELQRVGAIDICNALVAVARSDPDRELASHVAGILRGAGHYDLLGESPWTKRG